MASRVGSNAASASYQQHVYQNNQRLASIRKSLGDVRSYAVAAEELREWCSDPRAFQPPFEKNLLGCLEVVDSVRTLDGFDGGVAERLFATCALSAHLLSPEAQRALAGWDGGMNGAQGYVGAAEWNPESVSVLTTATVYVPPTSHYSQQPGHPYHPAHQSAYMHQEKQKAYSQAPMMPQSGYMKTQAGESYPYAQAQPYSHHQQQQQGVMKAAQVAAAAVATATATAVAFNGDPRQMGAYPPQYRQTRPQPSAYAHYQGQRAPQPQGPMRGPPEMYGNGMVQRLPPPPSYPGYAPRAPAAVRPPRLPQAAPPPPHQQLPPGHPQGHQAPGLQRAMSYGLRDVKPPIEDKMAFPIPGPDRRPILGPFRLDHNMELTTLTFNLPPETYAELMARPTMELQLKCFHHDDRTQANNWPAAQHPPNAPYTPPVSVQVTFNSTTVPIERTLMPLYLKAFARPNGNSIDIRVFQCCCSHFFVLQLVQRFPVSEVVNSIVKSSPAERPKALARLQRLMGPPSSGDGIERTSETVSLKCPISQQMMEISARGKVCAHIQCFDLRTFLRLNMEKAQGWQCPICQKPITSTDQIEADTFIMDILRQAPKDTEQVTIEAAGTWRPVPPALPALKAEFPPDASSCGPPMKRLKSEPGLADPHARPALWPSHSVPAPSAGPAPAALHPLPAHALSPAGSSHFSPAQAPPTANGYMSGGSGGVLSPYFSGYPQASPQAKGPATPGRYGPPTPATPQQLPAPSPANTAAQSPHGSQPHAPDSTAGSAPYTPASVGSAGSAHAQQSLAPDLDGLTGLDFFDAGGGAAQDNAGISETELFMRYLDGGTGSSAPQSRAPRAEDATGDSNDLLDFFDPQ